MRLMNCTAIAGLIVLGACSGGEKADGNATAAAGDTATASNDAGIVANPKAGLWEMKMASGTTPAGPPVKVCIGEAKPGANAFTPPPPSGTTCSKNEVKRVGSGVQVDTECTTQGITTVATMTVSGDFNTAYKTEGKMTMSGASLPASMPKEMTMTTEATYQGACPADMKPGQVRI